MGEKPRETMVRPAAARMRVAARPRQATGVKVGELTPTSAVIWVRRTKNDHRNTVGEVLKGKVDPLLDVFQLNVDTLEGAVPGAHGMARIRYGTSDALGEETEWNDLPSDYDYTYQFFLTGLKTGTRYHFAVDTKGAENDEPDAPLAGHFTTPPKPTEAKAITCAVTTCMGYKDVDDSDGFVVFKSLLKMRPDFYVATGDSVYLDSEAPRARTVPLARYHWQRMYSLPWHVEFHRFTPGYWEKDDHDTFADDCWPGQERPEMAPLTYEDGLRVITEQVPVGASWHRTARWGKCLQIWLTEGRDFRSPNTMPDGPEKSMWGAEQKKWLKESILASDADWRLIISPTPIVGPDREKKADNQANKTFQHEGDEIRQWIRDHGRGNVMVFCGDRHWQYHSVDPRTGVQEFACGPTSDQHAGGSPGLEKDYHRFHRVAGGFITIQVAPQAGRSQLTVRHHDVNGAVVYEYQPPRN